ncbi:MAG TPA: transglutaminase-like domain-containing protein, partial [Acidimicrobiales bacterium]|nr:transglutaminase-like domain-containing protein [Acidimicrobiales bacterium]
DVTDLAYTIIADVPEVNRRSAMNASGAIPRDIEQTFTRLPADFPADLTDEARRIVAGASTPYEQALALQRFFSPVNGFTYSTEIPSNLQGEDTNAIRAFLDLRTGFCEQFAGTYAALARAIGLPTRIAVGFTWGREVDAAPDGTRTFVVTGRNAHAWPEVYFADLGWLPFEPTPGRGNPAAESYTGVPAAQDDSGPGGTTVPTTTTPAQIPAVPTTAPPSPSTTAPSQATPPFPPTTPKSPSSGPSPTALVIGLIAVGVVGAGPIVRWLRRRRRWRVADTPARRLRLVWAETIHAWRPLGFTRRLIDTDRDVGDRLAHRIDNILGPDGPGVLARRLGDLASAAAWNGAGITDHDVREATDAAARIEQVAHDHRSRWAKVIGWFDPRLGPSMN